jgi:uncharacterized protein (TIGR02246 family)
MRAVSVCFALLGITIFVFAQGGTDHAAADHEIRDVLAQYVKARNTRDEAALSRLFAPDVDQLVSTGQWRHGRDELLRGAMQSSAKEAGNSAIDVVSVRLVGDDVAIADGRYQTTSAEGVVRKMWTAFVLRRTDAKWQIEAIRNMLPAPGK